MMGVCAVCMYSRLIEKVGLSVLIVVSLLIASSLRNKRWEFLVLTIVFARSTTGETRQCII